MTYEFVNIWPQNMTSMRVAYGDSNVLRCSVQLAYDRFFTNFNYEDTNQAIATDAFSLLNSKEQNRRYGLKNSLEPTYPDGSFGIGSKSTDKVSRHKTGHSSQYKKKRRGTAFQ